MPENRRATAKYYGRHTTYVPGMQSHSDVSISDQYRVFFGAPLAADDDRIMNGTSVNISGTFTYTASNFTSTANSTLPDLYGRNLVVRPSGTANGNATVRLTGRDYLGQLMQENISCVNGATTTIEGVKAFKYIDRIETFGGGTAVTATVGTGSRLGLPFRTTRVLSEELDGAPRATLGNLTAPVFTVQNITSSDPRGLYTPNSTLNGTAELTALFIADSLVNTTGVGGLHGNPHFGG